jgi:hypothetical protein
MLDQVSFQTLRVESVEVVAAQIGVGAAFLMSNHEDAMGNGDDGALSASTSSELLKLSER